MGMPIPEAIQNAPDLRLGLQLFFNGFMELSSSRPSSYGGVSPIPWHAIYDYCERLGLSEDQTEDMIHHVQAMDMAYVKKKSKPNG